MCTRNTCNILFLLLLFTENVYKHICFCMVFWPFSYKKEHYDIPQTHTCFIQRSLKRKPSLWLNLALMISSNRGKEMKHLSLQMCIANRKKLMRNLFSQSCLLFIYCLVHRTRLWAKLELIPSILILAFGWLSQMKFKFLTQFHRIEYQGKSLSSVLWG